MCDDPSFLKFAKNKPDKNNAKINDEKRD